MHVIPLEWDMNRSSGWHSDGPVLAPSPSNGDTPRWTDNNAIYSAAECNGGLRAVRHPANLSRFIAQRCRFGVQAKGGQGFFGMRSTWKT